MYELSCMSPFWKSFKLLKRKKKSPQHQPIKYCPHCREPTLTRTISGGWVNTEHYRCTNINCDYAGAFYLEVDPEENGKNLKTVNIVQMRCIGCWHIAFQYDLDLGKPTDIYTNDRMTINLTLDEWNVVDVVFQLEVNEWNGNRSLELYIEDLKIK